MQWKHIAVGGISGAAVGGVVEYVLTDGASGWVPLFSGLIGAVFGTFVSWGWQYKGKAKRIITLPFKKLQLHKKLELELETTKVILRATETMLAAAECERDEFKEQIKSKEQELSDLREDLHAIKREHGRWWINLCGSHFTSLDLSVSVQFVEPQDSSLADRIRGFFWSGPIPPPGFPWRNTRDIEQVVWFRNPSFSGRIVIFSDHDHAAGLKAAFNKCNLLEETVDRFDKSFAKENVPDVDIAIVVFPTVKVEE